MLLAFKIRLLSWLHPISKATEVPRDKMRGTLTKAGHQLLELPYPTIDITDSVLRPEINNPFHFLPKTTHDTVICQATDRTISSTLPLFASISLIDNPQPSICTIF